MLDNTRVILNQIYRPLDEKVHELIAKLTKLHGGFKVTSGFYNGHYHKNAAGLYQADTYPIPVISVMGLCDLEIDLDCITVTTKLSKEQIARFDWNTLGDVRFEVYGVEDYLHDYGNEQAVDEIKGSVLPSEEREFFVSFSFPTTTGGEEIMRFLRMLQKNHFYY